MTNERLKHFAFRCLCVAFKIALFQAATNLTCLGQATPKKQTSSLVARVRRSYVRFVAEGSVKASVMSPLQSQSCV